MRAFALLLLGLVGPVLPAQAGGVYKWVDAQGVTHYDDMSLLNSQRLTREYVEKRIVKDTPDWLGIVPAEFAHDVQTQCGLFKDRLANYRNATQMYGRDPGGNVYRLSKAQIGLSIAETERDAARFCAPDSAQRLLAQRRAELGEADRPMGY